MGIFIDNCQSTQLSNTEQSILLKLDSKPELLDNNLTQLAVEPPFFRDFNHTSLSKIRIFRISEFKFETQKLLRLTGNETGDFFFRGTLKFL